MLVEEERLHKELDTFQDYIRNFRLNKIGEVKMQKMRLQFGTYAQRQEGVQMQRIKLPGGFMSADQLKQLSDAADRFASGFIHFTTRQDAQLYYLKLEEAPDLMRFLDEANITTREACGNTVRNITTCYRSGTSPTEPFFVQPYAQALTDYLLWNKYNQTMGRKMKFAFEGCAEDHSGMRYHDIGFWATTREIDGETRRGFKVYLGGGLGSNQMLGQLYTDFLPVEELLGFTAAVVRIFDRHGERKKRMKARMKFLVQKLGWDTFKDLIDKEREVVGHVPLDDFYTERERPTPTDTSKISTNGASADAEKDPNYKTWLHDSAVEHILPGYKAVHVRLRLGDITAETGRKLAEVARTYSDSELRVTIDQNLYLPWVQEHTLPALYFALKEIGLADFGTETIMDVTTCPGADTCRLGIASAKGLGSAISDAFEGPMAKYREFADDIRIKISGCPNGCAQHAAANIGFHAAAMSKNRKNLPSHLLFLGGQTDGDDTRYAFVVNKYPAKNCVKIVERLLSFYKDERNENEKFNDFAERIGVERFKELLADLREAPDFEEDASFYEDFKHANEEFAIRKGVRGECAGTTIGELEPDMADAKEKLAQAEAALFHKEYQYATDAAYDAAADAARVPLYKRLVDPFTSEETLWRFENLFVLTGETNGAWENLTEDFNHLRGTGDDAETAKQAIAKAKEFISFADSYEVE